MEFVFTLTRETELKISLLVSMFIESSNHDKKRVHTLDTDSNDNRRPEHNSRK